MRRTLKTMALAGVLTIGGVLGLGAHPAQAQGFGGYGGWYRGGFGGRGGLPRYNPYSPWSPARQEGYREGRRYWETGRRPGHFMSPVERRGFYAGERREAYRPW